MPTTTIRLPEQLRHRVSAAAQRAGMSAHAFILAAIAEKTAADEQRAGFEAEAEARHARIAASGETIPWDDMRRYLLQHVAGEAPALPSARKLPR